MFVIGTESPAQSNTDSNADAALSPIITNHPLNQEVIVGGGATFNVSASGIGPISYQWKRGKNNIAGATTSVYTIPVTTLADSGAKFRCSVSNLYGAVLSNEATLTVRSGFPIIVLHPKGQTINDGQTAALTISVSGSMPLFYRWQRNRIDISGATNSSYSTPPLVLADSGTAFRCIVSNTVGSVTSNAAIISVNGIGPSITTQPVSQSVNVGSTS